MSQLTRFKFVCRYFNYDLFLKDILKQRWQIEQGRTNPLEDKTFLDLSVRERVEVLHALCDFRLDAEDVTEVLKVSLYMIFTYTFQLFTVLRNESIFLSENLPQL